ncbi:hypothetical protein VZT92_009273 [Zoarces viviparus]|uniref:Uncharacterized protein n=1 Tax=Zoarces viviparus TaxID=48416 RepID=A0AAW1FHV7_ZOAVI
MLVLLFTGPPGGSRFTGNTSGTRSERAGTIPPPQTCEASSSVTERCTELTSSWHSGPAGSAPVLEADRPPTVAHTCQDKH